MKMDSAMLVYLPGYPSRFRVPVGMTLVRWRFITGGFGFTGAGGRGGGATWGWGDTGGSEDALVDAKSRRSPRFMLFAAFAAFFDFDMGSSPFFMA
jgi:hypothetical protein